MARQNVGNPKFYIDLPSYWWASGNVDNLTNSKMIGLNPTDIINEEYEISIYNYKDFDIVLNENWHLPTSQNDKYFFAILGHNFKTASISNPEVIMARDGLVVTENPTFDEICNFQSADFQYNGWSLGQFETSGEEFDTLRFSLAGGHGNLTQILTKIGSFGFGHIFQMPHSPDLSLTMTREYDGIQEQKTRGGSTLTQINYSRPPDWAGLPAWHLSSENVDSYYSDGYVEPRKPARGRRVWSLKFSYVGSDDLFSINEMVDTANPTDSDTASDYTSSDFDNIGNFNYETFTDRSFMGQVMHKTMGGALPFIFQPDGNNNSPDQFAICKLDQGSFDFKQVAHNVYDISLKIREVW